VRSTVLHILPHSGGGAEIYLQQLAALPVTQRRMELSSSRSPLGAVPSIAVRWPRGAAATRHTPQHPRRATPTFSTCTATWRRSSRCR
jgi:hypothetical protein